MTLFAAAPKRSALEIAGLTFGTIESSTHANAAGNAHRSRKPVMKPISLAVFSSLFVACGLSLTQTSALQIPPSATKVSIELVGDSTQTESAGYGLGFCANLTADVACINKAKGGASTKTYLLEGYWEKALAAKPDYMLIQFGHNDEESKEHQTRETNLQTEYPVNLKRYVVEARAHGITPVLVTPLTRRYYGADGKIHSDLIPHA